MVFVPERRQEILAQAGYGSRCASENFISAGRVRVNEQVAILGQKDDPSKDKITVDGKPINAAEQLIYIALYKLPNVLRVSLFSPDLSREEFLVSCSP